MKTEIEIRFTIEADDYDTKEVKATIFNFLKELNVISLEMEEK